MEAKEIEAQLNAIQVELMSNKFPCTHMKAGASCVRQYDGKFDRKGRPVLYFGTGCKVAETFCESCLAYWHVAVARNAVLAMMRQ